jgi:hypothetical protein
LTLIVLNNILQINCYQKGQFPAKIQNFWHKICVIQNKVVTLQARIEITLVMKQYSTYSYWGLAHICAGIFIGYL